jgi:hypothetical protein
VIRSCSQGHAGPTIPNQEIIALGQEVEGGSDIKYERACFEADWQLIALDIVWGN